MTGQSSEERAFLKLASRLDSAAASSLKATLLDFEGRPITVDAGEVERLDALAAQVLLAAKMSHGGSSDTLTIENPSDAFRTHAEQLGLSDILMGETE